MTVIKIVMIGGFPPPMGGAAKANETTYRSMLELGADVVKLNVAAATLSHRRTLRFHAQRFSRNLCALLQARRLRRRDRRLYIVPDAGAGILYSLAHIWLAARAYGEIVIHHHSCRYIEEISRPMAMITKAAWERTVHVFLTPGMAAAFEESYGPVRHRIATNARFVRDQAAVTKPAARGRPRIGHLSNLCHEKGFFQVADAFDKIRAAGFDAELWLAGPALEPEVDARLQMLQEAHGASIHYVGPVTGEPKNDFYRSLDLFLFPTQFPQEAAPIVVYEALAAGAPVLSTPRGRIAEILGDGIWNGEESFGAFVLNYLLRHNWDGASIAARAAKLQESMLREAAESEAQFTALLKELAFDRVGATSTFE